MNSEKPSSKWRTIRISVPTYAKLVELTGFMTILAGTRTIPLSTIAEWAITGFYDTTYPRLKETVSHPQKLDEVRREVGLGLKRVYDSWDAWEALLKSVEESRKK